MRQPSKRSRRASGWTRWTTCCGPATRAGCFGSSMRSTRARARRASGNRSLPIRRTSTRSPSRSRCRIPATARSSGGSRASSGGTRSPWSCARTANRTASAATSRPTRPPRPSTRSASITSSGARTPGPRPTSSISRDTRRRDRTPGPSWRDGSPKSSSATSGASSGPAAGLSSYPHPWLMPEFWEFPTVSMGLGPLMAIYQARYARYLENRGLKPVLEPEDLGVPRRRRDRRAGVARVHFARGAREAGQPHLRHQLQPAAARRSRPRQRPDRAGARGGLPRRRLERHQGPVGIGMGPAARQGSRRRARPPHGRGRRRRIPAVRGRGRRLPAEALLGRRSRDCSTWCGTCRRPTSRSCKSAGTTR